MLPASHQILNLRKETNQNVFLTVEASTNKNEMSTSIIHIQDWLSF